jgi:hypothetical protein
MLSVQAERPERRAVLMVRRRSTVRFRKGAPVQRPSPIRIPNVVGTIVGTNGRQTAVNRLPMTPGRRDWHGMAAQTGLAARVVEHARPPLGAHGSARLLPTFGATAWPAEIAAAS